VHQAGPDPDRGFCEYSGRGPIDPPRELRLILGTVDRRVRRCIDDQFGLLLIHDPPDLSQVGKVQILTAKRGDCSELRQALSQLPSDLTSTAEQ
jgi:hypothetical protein